MEKELKTSEEWSNDPKYNDIKILDPDGWDRKNFDFSWSELITEMEFNIRLGTSTCSWPRSKLQG